MAAGRREGKDPRREKLLNFRHAGKCSRARCGICSPGKIHGSGARRAAQRRRDP